MRGKSQWLSAAVIVLLVAAVPAVALGQGGSTRAASKTKLPRQGEWRGKTQQGYRAIFDVVNTRDGYVVQIVDLEVDAQCGQVGIGFFVGGLRLKLGADNSFHRKFFDPFFGSFELTGKVTRTTGSGTAAAAIPLMNRNGTATVCSTGSVGWKAAAPPARQADGAATMHVAYQVRITQSPTGRIVWSRG